MPDPIRDALHAAALATMTAAEREHAEAMHNGQPGPGHIKRAAETVAAFHCSQAASLRAKGREFWPQAEVHFELAAAVERAARDGAP